MIAMLTAMLVVVPAWMQDNVLVDPAGHSLYTFEQDGPNASRCYGACAAEWPPLVAPPDALPGRGFTVVNREDGTRQWAFRARPLYRYAGDEAAGDRRGDNKGAKWHVVQR